MWSNIISIDRREKDIYQRLLSEVEGIREVSVAIEESKDRVFIYMAGLCEFADSIRAKIENLLVDVILTDYKLRYFRESIRFKSLNYANVSLLSTLVYLDYELERAYIIKVLSEVSGYDVDGIFRFRLKQLRASWKEIAEMCNRLFEIGTDDTDVYNVISYITATKTQKPVELALENSVRPVLYRLSDGEEVTIRDVFGNFDYNVINAVVSASATKLFVKGIDLNKETLRALKHIVRIKVN